MSNPKSILISEDNFYKYQSLAEIIKRFDPSIVLIHVSNIEDTVKELASNKYSYDLLIQDMQLPSDSESCVDIRGGLNILQYLEDSQNSTPFTFFSSHNAEYIVDICDQAGFPNVDTVEFGGDSEFWGNDILEVIKKYLGRS